MTPSLSIIILNYQSPGMVSQCVRGILAAQKQANWEVILVDNASGDGSVARLKLEFPTIRLIESPVNGGFAAGNNLGLLAARGEYSLILNPDIVVYPGAIKRLISFLESHPKAAIVAPQLQNPDGSVQWSCYRFPDPLVPILRRTPLGRTQWAQRRLQRYLMTDWDHRSQRQVDWALGACLLVRNKAIEQVGLMDERFFLYFEDVDWCRRFRAQGWEIWYHPEACFTHYHQRLSAVNPGIKGVLSAATRIHIVSGLLYFLKYGSRPPTAHA